VTTGALVVDSTLGAGEVGDPELLHNARVFLATLRDDGPAKATAAGNLAREFVARLLPQLQFEEGYRRSVAGTVARTCLTLTL
jgi:hypothetical protein